MEQIDVATLKAQLADVHLIDVREPAEYASGHVPGAISMPLATVPVRINELPRMSPVHIICQSGGRSMQAAAYLAQAGYSVVNVSGGTGSWIMSGFPVEH